jgi:hypothetical protein
VVGEGVLAGQGYVAGCSPVVDEGVMAGQGYVAGSSPVVDEEVMAEQGYVAGCSLSHLLATFFPLLPPLLLSCNNR